MAYQQWDSCNSQIITTDRFYWPPVKIEQCISGKEKNPDDGIIIVYIDEDCSLGYGKI